MNESQYINLQTKQWRAITTNWDILSTYSNSESRLYCLTPFQAAWLLSVTEYFRWSSRWENCPCTQSDLDAMKAEMEYNLMNCLDFQPYQLQYLYDSAQQNLIGDYTASWDGSNPSSVNPDAPDDFFNGDGSQSREDALCTALTLWSYSYAVNWSQKASLILGLAYAAGQLIDFMIPVGGQIAVQVIADLSEPLQSQVDALNNLDALDEVICQWNGALQGLAINASNWNSSISGLSFVPESDEWIIQQLFNSDTQLLGNFLSFVNSLGEGYELAQIGVFICACRVCTEVSETFDFTIQEYGDIWTPRPDTPPQQWISGQGWEGLNEFGVQVYTDRYVNVTSVSEVSTGSGGTPVRAMFDYDADTNTPTFVANLPFSGDYDVVNSLLIVTSQQNGGETIQRLEEVSVDGCTYDA